MILRLRQVLPLALALATLAGAVAPTRANEDSAGEQKKAPAAEPKLPGMREVPHRKPMLSPIKPLAVEGMKGVENYCGAIANSAASARPAWQEQRITALQAELVAKIAEVDAKTAELRDWVGRREALLNKAGEDFVTIYSKMKPEAASAQMQEMDDETAAALLLKMKPAVASAVMNEMNAARAARLSDLLTGVTAKPTGKKS